jgi:hypothetical protein
MALDVLGRAHARRDRAADVGDGGVALEVDVVAVPAAVAGGDREDRRWIASGRRRRAVRRARRRAVAEAGRGGSSRSGARAVVPGGRRIEDPVGGARCAFAVGHMAGQPLVPPHPPLGLGPQLQGGAPAARHGEQVARDPPPVDAHRLQAIGAVRLERLDPVTDVEHLGAEQLADRAAGVGRRQDDRRAAREHAVALPVGAHGAGQHDAGEVVALEGQQPLLRSGRQDDPLRPHVPQPRAALDEHREAVVVVADGGGVRQHAQLGIRPQAGRRRAIADEDHARAGAPGRIRRGPPRRPGADDEHVAVGVHAVVTPTVGAIRQTAAHGEARGLQPLAQRHARGRHHRLAVDLHERVWLVPPCRDDAPGAPVVHRAGDDPDVVGDERARERVALEAGQLRTAEREPKRARPVDVGSALRQPHRMSWVTVSRTTSNHRRQPLEWHQRSACAPRGLARTKRYSAHSSSESAAGSSG